jgi:hypothetical protein
LSKERLCPAAAGAVPGKSPNALSKSLKVASFGGSGDENGEVKAGKGLLSFAGIGGKGLTLWASAAVPTAATCGDAASIAI